MCVVPKCQAYHARRKLKQLLLGFLHTLGIPFDTDQVALLVVWGNADRHLVLVLNAVDWVVRATQEREQAENKRKEEKKERET